MLQILSRDTDDFNQLTFSPNKLLGPVSVLRPEMFSRGNSLAQVHVSSKPLIRVKHLGMYFTNKALRPVYASQFLCNLLKIVFLVLFSLISRALNTIGNRGFSSDVFLEVQGSFRNASIFKFEKSNKVASGI